MNHVPLPRISGASLEVFAREYEAPGRPVILGDAVRSWRALGLWSPQYLREKLAGIEVRVNTALPAVGTPYALRAAEHEATVPFEQLIDRIEAGERVYLQQANLDQFAAIRDDVDVSVLSRGQVEYPTNVWVGANTRSGMHFDSTHNFLTQIWGSKEALLAAPDCARHLAVFPDNPTKSQIDPDRPDPERFPGLREMVFHRGRIDPGDSLFIPRGWWHNLRAEGASISINSWYGPPLTLGANLQMLYWGGSAVFARAARDLVMHGILGREYAHRLFSPPPFGLMIYNMVRSRLGLSARDGARAA
jgi:lysine-specific demethylase 8